MGNKRSAVACVLLLAATAAIPAAAGDAAPGMFSYLEWDPPADRPVVFAPGVVSTAAFEFAGCFTPDGGEYYFTRRIDPGPNRILFTRSTEKGWTAPVPASFASPEGEMEPMITPDGSRLYYVSDRPAPEKARWKGPVWCVDREGEGWSEPRYLDAPLNDGFAMGVCPDREGNLYFTKKGIRVSRPGPEGAGLPELLGDAVNAPRPGAHPYVAPEGSLLLFDADRGDGVRNMDFFVSFRDRDGEWTGALPLGPPINTPETEMCASLSPDGRILFFTRIVGGDGDIYGIDASFLNGLRREAETADR
ncbi:MAG: PD40 domain-containing protein [Candidatus Eisenbacteria bacterium]|nr:PD40 domain-containing protein [Candidatus Eisenbacteria bacterium]